MPDTKLIKLGCKDAKLEPTLMVCSDGVWEFIESKMAADMLRNDKADTFCENLAKAAWDKWMKDSDGEISDDITALVINLAQSSLGRPSHLPLR